MKGNFSKAIDLYPNGDTMVPTLKEPEYFIAYFFDPFLANMVKKLMLETSMEGLLDDIWKHHSGEPRH